MRQYVLKSFSRRIFAEKHQRGKASEQGRLVGLDYGPDYCGVAVSNPKFTDWTAFGTIYMAKTEPPNKFASRFNPINWGATRLFEEAASELAKVVTDQEAVGLVVGIPDKPTPEQLMDASYVNNYDAVLKMIKDLRDLKVFPRDFPLLLLNEFRTSRRGKIFVDHRIMEYAKGLGHWFRNKKEAKGSFIYKELLDSFSGGSMLDAYFDRLHYPSGDVLTFLDCFQSDFMERYRTGVVEVEGVDFRSNSFFEPEVVSAEELEFRSDRLWCMVKARLDREQGDSTLWTILDSRFKKDYTRMWSAIECKASEVGYRSGLDLNKQKDDRMLYNLILELFKKR